MSINPCAPRSTKYRVLRKGKGCLEAAKAFGDPDLLLSAHFIYLEAMRTASHAEDATESDTYLREHPIKNPQLLLALAGSGVSGAVARRNRNFDQNDPAI